MSLLSPTFYRHLLSNSTDLLSVLDQNGVFKFVGDSVTPILGFMPDEIVGKSVFEFIHAEDHCHALTALQQIHTLERLTVPKIRFKKKDGTWRWLDCTATNLLSDPNIAGIITNSRDITETVEAEEEKDLHQAYYKSLFQEHPDAVFSIDKQGYFKTINKNFTAITGYTREKVLNTHFLNIIREDEVDIAKAAFKLTLSGESFSNEIRILDADGKKRILSISLMPVYIKGAVEAVQGIAKDITELKIAHRLIKEQTKQLSNIVESITEPFFALDENWRFTFVNAAFCTFIGKPEAYFKGHVIWEIFPDIVTSRFYKKCHEVAETKVTQYIKDNYVLNNNLTLSFSIFPSDGGIAVHFVDSTAQVAIQRELEKLSLVASKTINGVVILDAEGRVEWVNDGFTRLTGYSKEEVTGKIPSSFLQGEETDSATSRLITEGYKSKKYFTAEVINYRKNREKYWVKIDVSPILDSAGELLNFVAIQTDITEKKKSETEQIKLTDDLYKHNLNLQLFTYMVSHNLRAPVANALGLSGLVKRLNKDTPQFDTALDKLYTSITQLDGVIKDINTILSVRDADKSLPRELVNLQNITQEVLDGFSGELIEQQATVHLDIDNTFEMLSNRAYLYSILLNLVSNAIKYKHTERPLILSISVAKDRRGYVFTVCDNGLGMDMHIVENQLFKLYKRFHPNTHGKGVGLFLVKTQVEAIGGKIEVESKPNVGTKFKLLLGAKHV
ncbi:PAS domain S-box protein [Pontibacter sp. MBLB2868]|uniref:PAS domain-containing sensor histidine kinase n=1 Tax=Pontibacter sp. MBLB2868 TaxID=3451555 RepID=UPI003F74FA67